MQRLSKVGVFAALFVVSAALTTFSPSQAAKATCGTQGNFFAGGDTKFSTIVLGASARIEYNNPDLCGSDSTGGSSSTAWSMVSAPSVTFPTNANAVGWAQTGYGQFAHDSATSGEGIHPFAQYSLKCRSTLSCLGDTVDTYLAPGGVTSGQIYSNVWKPSDGFVHMSAGSVQLLQTDYNPFGYWESAWQGQFSGEVIHAGSDVPGTAADVTSIYDIKRYDSSGNAAFFATVFQNTPTVSRHHVTSFTPTDGGNGLKIWTDPLS